jgi:hypothetical protein
LSISLGDAERLHRAGFLDAEIEEFSSAQDSLGRNQPPINLSSPVWQSVLRSRRDWTDERLRRGWTPEEIENEIKRYYRMRDTRSPWDFIKAEYRPRARVDYLSRIRSSQQIKKMGIQRYRGRIRRKS